MSDEITAHDRWNARAHLKVAVKHSHGQPVLVDGGLLAVAVAMLDEAADAERRGYERAIEVLRDEKAYAAWMDADIAATLRTGQSPRRSWPFPMHAAGFADYLESVASSLVKGEET